MNQSKLYIPDPSLWINFFKHKTKKQEINQKGGSKVISTKRSNEPLNVELISPVEAADERTHSNIRRLVRKKKRVRHPRKRINKKRKVVNQKKTTSNRKSTKRRVIKVRSKRDIFHK